MKTLLALFIRSVAPGRICLVASVLAAAAVHTFAQVPLVDFNNTDGANPYLMSMIQATGGELYGTTRSGGANGYGSVFRMTPSGTITAIYSFCSLAACADGSYPSAGVVQASDGNFYGTTEGGGANGYGTVFRVTKGGALTTLHSFCSVFCANPDGANVNAGLIQASDGALYGATQSPGTIFQITLKGDFTTIYSFTGQGPVGALLQSDNGLLYGTAYSAGAYGKGSVFSFTLGGGLATLYSFCQEAGCPDGSLPMASLIRGTDGYFYGTTFTGGAGADGGYGTVFKISPAGKLTTLHSFEQSDGANPYAPLVQATDGNFYGTTNTGNGSFAGTVFQITPSGTLTTLVSETSLSSGASPTGGLMQYTDGNLYGTTNTGGVEAVGDISYGTVYELSMGLRHFVTTTPSFAKVGTKVIIQGTNLTGATSVTFDGTPATFTVVSASEITTAVPTGATSGEVQVITPSGTIKSNVAFVVWP
jgi:uncharacterized repeat protein (TIGR03803 family)